MENIIKEYINLKEDKRKELILSSNFNDLGWDKKKEYLKFECNHTCQSCNNNIWMGEPIPLEVDHIDGDNTNNSKNNLKVLCSNCHGLTENWRGRNKTNKRFRISNEELFRVLLKNDWNFRVSLIDVGLTAKGGNYKRCHAIKREYEELGYVNNSKKLYNITKEMFFLKFNESSNYRELGDKLNISYKRARQYSIEYGYKFEKKQIPSLIELLENYKLFGSFTQLSLFYGMSDNGVRKWFVKYGIDPKKIKDYTNNVKIEDSSPDGVTKHNVWFPSGNGMNLSK
jgi:hypothetical protein